LIGAMVGVAGMVTSAGAQSSKPQAAPPAAKLPASNFKPTLETPLPPMDSPLTFHLSDESSYWYDNGRADLEGFLHTRSVAAGVSPLKVKFSIGEPYTSANHTVSSILWPTGAKNMPFVQQGAFTGDTEVE